MNLIKISTSPSNIQKSNMGTGFNRGKRIDKRTDRRGFFCGIR